MGKSVRYQFTMRRLLLLSTAIAVAFAVAGGFRGPLIFKVFVGVYFASLAGWVVMRWPAVRENWRESQRQRLAAIRQKRELALEVAKQKPRVELPKLADAETVPDSESQ
ncbi:hypothetical protein [Lacipirellula sp.]|uniref:hypothetical protein n=1 Tax=Lacipirellula sp. TaxID=2691419 RepID=UPI003D0C2E18